jgi:hypothetical protein
MVFRGGRRTYIGPETIGARRPLVLPMLAPAVRAPAALAALGLAASLVGAALTITALAVQASPPADPCALDVDAGALSARDRGFVARRQLACRDVAHGRITLDDYRRQIADLDRAWSAAPPAPPEPPAPVQPQWASTVRGFSTQYTPDHWSASRVLGAPDVFPGQGDNVNAWASLGADDRDEWIEVGFARPMRASAVEVFETLNPGAVSAIELVTASGARVTAYQGQPAARGPSAHRLHADVECTREPIVAVHVKLASTRVAGWNELDAIGLVPCAEP